MSDIKQQVAIYRIREGVPIATVTDTLERKGYNGQALSVLTLGEYDLRLFYNRRESTPKWKSFLQQISASTAEVVSTKKTWAEGFVLLFHHSVSDEIYVLAGGPGYSTVESLIQMDFGLDIIARMISKEDKILRTTREQNVAGGIQGTTKHFRTDFTIHEIDSFGSIYQELAADLNTSALQDKLGLPESLAKKGAICVAKSCFRLRRAITLQQVVILIDGFRSIIATRTPIVINNVVKLTKKRDQSLIDTLEDKLIRQLWTRFETPFEGFQFDLCHRDYDKYLTATSYIVRKGAARSRNFFKGTEFDSMRSMDDVFDALRKSKKKPGNFEAFRDLIRDLSIFAYDDDGVVQTEGLLLSHVFGDVPEGSDKYFYIDAQWYKIEPDFINKLNEQCKSFIRARKQKELHKKWTIDKDENAYIQEYIGEDNTIVLDRVLPENIEVCDMMKWDDENLYLYHLKSGVDNAMRDLCSQVVVSASRVKSDTSMDFVRTLYASLKGKKGGASYFDLIGRQCDVISEDAFVELFSTRKLVFVLAVRDKSKGRNIENIEDFSSSIAKFSIRELVKSMKSIDMDLHIEQVEAE